MKVDFIDNGERAKLLKNVKRVVVKVGSRLLMDVDGVSARQRVTELVKEIAILRERGLEVILVTSGAVATGMELLKTKVRPKSMASKQAHAAVGQCELMGLYEAASSVEGFHCAQLLLTAADLHDQERRCRSSTKTTPSASMK